jgi:hypothetical protein
MGAAHKGAKAGAQLAQIDRFDDVIIGSGIEPLNSLRDGIPRG